jgi:hypothetical protein
MRITVHFLSCKRLRGIIDRALDERVFPLAGVTCWVEVMALGYHASLLGAAAQALGHVDIDQ